MPVFTSIGLALVGTAGVAAGVSAFAVGVGATAIAAGVGYAAYSSGQAKGAASASDSRVNMTPDTGELTEAEAQTAAKKRAFRSGVLFTSPLGKTTAESTSSAKLR